MIPCILKVEDAEFWGFWRVCVYPPGGVDFSWSAFRCLITKKLRRVASLLFLCPPPVLFSLHSLDFRIIGWSVRVLRPAKLHSHVLASRKWSRLPAKVEKTPNRCYLRDVFRALLTLQDALTWEALCTRAALKLHTSSHEARLRECFSVWWIVACSSV